MKTSTLIYPFVLLLNGCFFLPADSWVTISGNAPKELNCNLILLNGDKTIQYGKKNVSGKFKKSFSVVPGDINYIIKTICDNKVINVIKVRSIYDINLGNIKP